MHSATPDTTRYGGYILTFSCIWFYPLDPKAEDVEIEDLAQGLDLKCRWSGQCKVHYPVSLHCLTVADLGAFLASRDGRPPEFVQLVHDFGLVHDANEAYLPDMPGPIKKYIEGWKPKEFKLQAAIHEKFGLAARNEQVETYVKWADLMMLALEQEALFDRVLTPAELYNNYEMRELWPGYPVVSSEVRAFVDALNYDDQRAELVHRLKTLTIKE